MANATPECATPEKLLLGKAQAAILLGISARTLWGITSPRGPIPCIRIGHRVLYPYDLLRDWVAQSIGQSFFPGS